jgi:hypothetical protein
MGSESRICVSFTPQQKQPLDTRFLPLAGCLIIPRVATLKGKGNVFPVLNYVIKRYAMKAYGGLAV